MTFTFEIMCHLPCMKDEKFLLKWSKFKLPLHSPKPGFLQCWRKQGDVFMKSQKLRLHKAPRLFFFLAHPQPFAFLSNFPSARSALTTEWEAAEGSGRQ